MRLAQAEACESNAHYRDDLRIARLTVSHAARGDAVLCSPHVLASYEVLGLHPDKVWPAIQARRKSLGLCEETGAPPVPKKPAQSVKLWCEKTNGARAANSRAVNTLLRDNTISVPMAAPSIAAGYPNSDAPSSGKGEYSYDQLIDVIERSGAPEHVRNLTLAALVIRGRWPKKQGPVTPVISVSITSLQDKSGVWRSTIQRRIHRAKKDKYWREVRAMNSWLDCPKCGAPRESAKCSKCPHKGNGLDPREFRRTFTYAIDVEKFERAAPCRQVRQIRELKARGKGEVAQMPAPLEQPPAARPRRPELPKLSKTEVKNFAENVEQRKRGCTSYFSRADGLRIALHPGEEGYALPMTAADAFAAECASIQRDPDVVRAALKFWGYQLQE